MLLKKIDIITLIYKSSLFITVRITISTISTMSAIPDAMTLFIENRELKEQIKQLRTALAQTIVPFPVPDEKKQKKASKCENCSKYKRMYAAVCEQASVDRAQYLSYADASKKRIKALKHEMAQLYKLLAQAHEDEEETDEEEKV